MGRGDLYMSDTNKKGDIAVIKIMADLMQKGYDVLTPTISAHLPFDIVAHKNGIFTKIQAKYSTSGFVVKRRIHYNSEGVQHKNYAKNDFDYYGVYLPDIDKVVYPSISMGGITIASILPNSAAKFYWWEDFSSFTDKADKHSFKEFGVKIVQRITEKRKASWKKQEKVAQLSKKDLKKLLWEKPTTQIAKALGVSDTLIGKWAKQYGLTKPPRGYWAKQKSSG